MAGQRSRKMIDSLQQSDPDIGHVVVYSKFVVVFFKDDTTNKWHQPGIEGVVYIVRRISEPWYMLIVKNKLGGEGGSAGGDIMDGLDPDWETDSKEMHICYKTGDSTKNVRCLWFAEDAERMKFQASFEIALERYRTGDVGPMVMLHEGKKKKADLKDGEKDKREENDDTAASLFKQFGIKNVGSDCPPVLINRKNLSQAWYELSNDENFLRMIMQRCQDAVDGKTGEDAAKGEKAAKKNDTMAEMRALHEGTEEEKEMKRKKAMF